MIVSIDGGDIGYDDNGHGEAVVFVHGFPHDRTLWSQQRVALASRARCIALDLPGFGESSVRTGTSIDMFGDIIMRLLDHLGIDRATICGLSMGGYVAMGCWRRHAARVSGLILCDTKAGADTDEGRTKRNETIELVKRQGVSRLAAVQISGMLGKRTRESNASLIGWTRAMMERQPAAGVVAALGAMRDRPDSLRTLRSVKVPTLIIVGEDDVITPPSEARAILEALPEAALAQLDIIAGAGHASCVERPAAVTHAIADYLAARTARQH